MGEAIAAGGTEAHRAVFASAADDLDLLCRLHDREPDGPLLSALAERPARDWFGLSLAGSDAIAAYGLLDGFLARVAAGAEPNPLDALAADFAELYLTFGKRLSPSESYWLTEDHLERQEPMFSVRKWYAHYGVAAGDWRNRADDHLVHQLEFVALLLRDGGPDCLRDAGRFLDCHLLAWSPSFLGGVARRADTAFYAGLALATEAHLQAIRELLEAATGEARMPPPPLPGLGPVQRPEGSAPFMPGAGPGW